MSKAIEDQIVKMEFDNAGFEKNVKTSLSTLDKLRNALRFEGVASGLSNLSNLIRGVDFNPMSNALDTVSSKFSYLEMAAFSFINNLVDRATNAGIALAKSLSVDQISAGWDKFADKTTSVATLVAQGYSMDEVESQLSKLNWFTDETSYNFVDMVSSIGKFTASGQKLDESVTAMMGIANWAALSGANAQKASSAMYQLSQAMGKGALKLDDYKSIQNVGMDTEEFRKKCIDAAIELGTLKQTAEDTYSVVGKGHTFALSSFTEYLSTDAWLNSDVMMKVFGEYSAAVDQLYDYVDSGAADTASDAIEALGDQVDQFGLKAFKAAQEARSWADVVDSVKDAVSTGWMTTFEMIFGNYQESKVLWTDMANWMYDLFAEGGNARNEMLANWKEGGGRTYLWDGLYAVADNISAIVETLKDSFATIFPPKTTDQLIETTKRFSDFCKSLTLSEDQLQRLGDRTKIIFANLGQLGRGLGKVVKVFADAFSRLTSSVKGFLDNSEYGVMDVFVFLCNSLSKALDTFYTTYMMVVGGAGKTSNVFFGLFAGGAKALGRFTESVLDFISEITGNDGFSTAGETIKAFIDNLVKTLDTVFSGGEADWSWLFPEDSKIRAVGKNLGEFYSKIKAIFTGDVFKSNGGGLNGIFQSAATGCKALIELVVDLFGTLTGFDVSKFKDSFSKAFENIKDTLAVVIERIQNGLKSLFDSFKKDDDISTLDGMTDNLTTFGKIIGTVFVVAARVVETLTKAIKDLVTNLDGNLDFSKITDIFSLLVSGSIIEFFRNINGFIGSGKSVGKTLSDTLETIGDATEAFKNKVSEKTFMELAASIAILVGSLVVLSAIDPEKLGTSVLVLAGLMYELCESMKVMATLMGRSKFAVQLGASLVLMATAVSILAGTLAKIGKLSVGEAAQGVVVIGSLIAMLTLAAKVLSDEQVTGILGAAAAYVVMAVGIKILASAIKTLGEMPITNAIMGLGMVYSALFIMMVTAKQLDGQQILKQSAAILVMASAMVIFGAALKIMSSIKGENLASMIVSMASILVFCYALFNGVKEETAVKTAAAMLVLSTAMTIFALSLKLLSTIGFDELIVAMIAVGSGLFLMNAALSNSKASIKGAAALLVMSAGLVAFALALKIISKIPIVSLAVSMLTIVAALIAFGVVATALAPVAPALLAVGGALALIGLAVTGVGAGILMLATGLSELAIAGPAGIAMLSAALLSLIALIPEFISTFVMGVVNGILLFVTTIAENIPVIISAIGEIILAILGLLDSTVPALINLVVDIIVALVEAIASNAYRFTTAALTIIADFLQGIADGLPDVMEAAKNVIVSFIIGIADMLEDIIQAGWDLIIAFIDGLTASITDGGNLERLMNAVWDLAQAIVKQLIAGLSAFGDFVSELWNAGKNAVSSFVDGLLGGKDEVEVAGKEIAERAKDGTRRALNEHSPSKEMEKIGAYASEGFANGILSRGHKVDKAASDVGDSAIDSMSAALTRIMDSVREDVDMSPTITPVLDLTDIQNGVSKLDNMIGKEQVASISSNINSSVKPSDYEMQDRMLESLTERMRNLMKDNPTAPTPVEVNVSLEGDADGVFNLVKNVNNQYIKSRGSSPLAVAR